MAFLNRKIDKVVHMQIPPTFEAPENDGKCYHLKKALYGLKQAGNYKCLDSNGAKQSHESTHKEPKTLCIFSIMDQGNILHIIGMNVKYNCESQMLLIDETGYIEGLLEKFAFAVRQCTHFVANPSSEHLVTAKWIIRYLIGVIDVSLVASQASVHVTAKTLEGHSHNQELELDSTIPILYSDSSGARVIANDPQHFKRTKHIDIMHFFLWDKVADGQLTITPIQSSENLADILTNSNFC
ncbi:uncharacterized protein UHO2_00404 [Ustilago hordei]|uniref:uncharacterized protein n=1 Tax=Ustilago hordei TaxID=120017 RepID=UPI001A55EAAA|nr:uncharacterized protein UHO2_00404 [Ustilago hordei]SYW81900.1 uncharacterized protein UHO2_00404 [Ustilago hordei]